LQRGPPAMWVIASILLMISGCVLASASIATSAAGLYVAVGVLMGAATAAVYLPVYQPLLAWFPDRKGLVAGCIGVGQAAGGSLWNAFAPLIASRIPGSMLMLVFGFAVSACWAAGVCVTWPPSGRPDAPRRQCPSTLPMLLAAAHRLRHALMLWGWLACAMLSGFAFFAIMLPWLQTALALPPTEAGAASTAFGMAFLIGRLVLGAVYDRLGARRFALMLHAANVTLHFVLAVEQAIDGGRHRPATEAAFVVPLLLLLLVCNAGTVTMWGPLSIDLLGAEGKQALPLMVTSLSAAQAVGASLMGALADAHGVADSLLPFFLLAGSATALSGALLRKVLRSAGSSEDVGKAFGRTTTRHEAEPANITSASTSVALTANQIASDDARFSEQAR